MWSAQQDFFPSMKLCTASDTQSPPQLVIPQRNTDAVRKIQKGPGYFLTYTRSAQLLHSLSLSRSLWSAVCLEEQAWSRLSLPYWEV